MGKASADNELLPGFGAMQTPPMGFKNGTDTLLFGRVDEAAGIDQHDIRIIGIVGQFVAMTPGIAEENLGIDEVLGTAETDQPDFTHWSEWGLGCG